MKNTYRNILAVYDLIFRKAGGLSLLNVALSAVRGVIPLAILLLIRYLIDFVADYKTDPSPQTIIIISLMIVGSYLLAALLALGGRLINEKHSQFVSDKMYKAIHEKVKELSLAFFETGKYNDLLFRASKEISYRPSLIVAGIISVFQNLLSLAAVSIVLVLFDWRIVVVLFVASIPLFILKLRTSSNLFSWQKSNTPAERMLNYFNRVLTEPVFVKEKKIFGYADYFRSLFVQSRKDYEEKRVKLVRRQVVAEGVIQMVIMGVIFILLLSVVRETTFAKLSIGQMVMYVVALQRGVAFTQGLMKSIAGLYENSLFLSNYFELISIEEIREKTTDQAFSSGFAESIRIDNLTFAYPGMSKNAVDNVSFDIPQGKVIALVGENGAGKSTLVKLLTKLYSPSGGRIHMGESDSTDIPDDIWRSGFSTIFQDYILYQLSIRDNILLGYSGNDAERALMNAVQVAGIDRFIDSLPQGLDTRLGNLFDDSQELSEGEWQKIALARAVCKDAPVYILDEPVRSLDARAESEILDRFFTHTMGKTVLVISHRLSTVKKADTIFVLEKGKIIEKGSHEELMSLKGKYHDMFTIQSKNYS